jgi:hypothetical protein
MYLPVLGSRLARRTVAAGAFTPLKLWRGAADADENDIKAGQHGQAVQQAPLLAQDMVGHDVVACLGHAGHRPVKPCPGPGEHGAELGRAKLQGPRLF